MVFTIYLIIIGQHVSVFLILKEYSLWQLTGWSIHLCGFKRSCNVNSDFKWRRLSRRGWPCENIAYSWKTAVQRQSRTPKVIATLCCWVSSDISPFKSFDVAPLLLAFTCHLFIKPRTKAGCYVIGCFRQIVRRANPFYYISMEQHASVSHSMRTPPLVGREGALKRGLKTDKRILFSFCHTHNPKKCTSPRREEHTNDFPCWKYTSSYQCQPPPEIRKVKHSLFHLIGKIAQI